MSAGANRVAYGASPIKRYRSTRDQVGRRRQGLWRVVAANKPMTVRQVFYQATVQGLVDKTEQGYRQVQNDLVLMRRAGELPFGWLADSTRWQRKPNTWTDPAEALRDMALSYRKSLWQDAGAYVEVWLEKDALAGVLYPVTEEYDVPLMVSRGYASLSFLHEAAEFIGSLEVPTYIYHLGDFDPSGVNAGERIEQDLREFSGGAEIHFERIAVTSAQIAEWDLPTRPTKASDSRARNFGDVSVELDAIPPKLLRELTEHVIQRHLPLDQLKTLLWIEKEERDGLLNLVGEIG